MDYHGKKVAVVGLAANNTPLIRDLASRGAHVTALDKKSPEELQNYMSQLHDISITYHLGADYLQYLQGHDEVFLSPGIPRNQPELQAAEAAGVKFRSEMELFFELCPCRIIGITGSSGKTTTTTLTGLIMQRCAAVRVGGNIGRPPISFLAELTPESLVVLELSSFQLQSMKASPQLSVVTNVTPNHLDVHKDMAEYIDAKAHILRYQTASDLAVLNWDNDVSRSMAEETPGRVYYFSRQERLKEGAYLVDDGLYLKVGEEEEFLCRRGEIPLPGDHNVENVLTAALVCRLAGAPMSDIRAVVTEFTGVEHRLELVKEIHGVKYYNDSISTTPDRAMAGLTAIPAPIVLIAGGYDKHLPFDEFARVAVSRCKTVVLLGVTAPIIHRALEEAMAETGRQIDVAMAVSLEEAVHQARKSAVSGDVVLLSPACASYDMFRNFEERGKLFKNLVQTLD